MVNSANKAYNGPPCERCGRSNHPTDRCVAKKREDGTLLHVEASVDDEIKQYYVYQVSAEHILASSPNDIHALMFLNADACKNRDFG